MKYLILASLLFLAACDDPTPEEKEKLKNALPEGCEMIDVGEYGSIDSLIIVKCDGRNVVATYGYKHQSNGKSSETDRSAVFIVN